MQTKTHHGARRGLGLALAAALVALGLAGASSAQAACFGKKPTIKGTSGADRITGTNGPDVIYAGRGNDRINGKGGPDRICAGPGKDRVKGAIGLDTVGGGLGNDKVSGGKQADYVSTARRATTRSRAMEGTTTSTGSTATTSCTGIPQARHRAATTRSTGGDGADQVFGDGGDDGELEGGEGADLVDGGAGKDTVFPDDDSTPDTYRGGAGSIGRATATTTGPVTVSLDGAANDGVNCPQQCEGDNLAARWRTSTAPTRAII